MGGYPVQAIRTGDEVELQAVSGKVSSLQIMTKLGDDPRLFCACGASLILNYFADNGGIAVMTHRLTAFLDEHEACV
jgi:hypothetical protein